MAKSTITIDATIPNDEENQPLLLVFDTGDWEITSGHEAEYVIQHIGDVLVVIPFVSVYIGLLGFFGVGDHEDVNTDDDEIELSLCEETSAEPVVLVLRDGEFDIVAKAVAEHQIADESYGAYNFIAIEEILFDFGKWLATYQEELEEDEFADRDDFDDE